MAETEVTVRKIIWSEVCPWLILFRSVRITLMARVLVLGALGLILTTLGWRAIAWMYEGTSDDVVARWSSANWLWNESGFTIDLSARSASQVAESAIKDILLVPAEAWLYLTAPFRHMFDGELTASGFLCMLFACVWEMLVWGVIGGAIARIAALKYTRDEAPSFTAALRHSIGKLPSYSFGPLIALAGAAVFGIQLVVLGLAMNIGVLAVLASIIWPFVLVLGLLMAILLLGALVGWPLMWATVAVEGTDSFDALSRSYAYTYQRPWRLLFYVAFSVFLAAVSMFVVKAFAISAVGLGDWSISWGLDGEERSQILGREDEKETSAPALGTAPPIVPVPPVEVTLPEPATVELPAEPGWSIKTANRIIKFWQFLWKSLAAGYQAAFIWVSAVGIYLLLRRDIDGAELDEVYLDHADEHGLPPLEEDPATGVPEVAPSRAAQPADPGGANT